MEANQMSCNKSRDEAYLGELAMRFRGTRDLAQRQALAEDYSQTVTRLVKSGLWQELPSPEDQLPDQWMPKEFYAYWFGDDDNS